MDIIIPLTKGQEALVCECHYHLVKNNKWHFDNRYAARSHAGGKKSRMHQVICRAPKGLDVDHINRNKLDNRCSNLRIVSRSENLLNQDFTYKLGASGIKGVTYDKSRGKWLAHRWYNGRSQNLGRFNTKEEAALRVSQIAL